MPALFSQRITTQVLDLEAQGELLMLAKEGFGDHGRHLACRTVDSHASSSSCPWGTCQLRKSIGLTTAELFAYLDFDRDGVGS